ncbi:MAG: glycosyltransferase [Desulfuromonadaceae bacterium]|nr:glycosyltransferase [Desulfuromonadaceae bacterium]MDD2848194.1 glycosyltransferase [Desulfuromonadaceae bacterium]MDD4130639.1 glycosyltransferase [Desulfuromonadaceae bacterium]
MPIVSVILPIYNKAPFLREAISSILSQSFQDFELIIVDDKSTDNSVAIAEEFNDRRIRFFNNTRNMGQANTLNNGIEKATGKYVTFAHGDDIWLNSFLERHVTLLDQHSGVNVSHARAHSVDEAGNVSSGPLKNEKHPYAITDHQTALKRLMRGSYLTTPTAFLRKSSLPYFNNRFVFACDWELWLRLAAAGNDFLYIDEPLIYYRHSPNNVTSTATKTGINIIEDYLVLTTFFEKNPTYQKFKGMALRKLSMSTLRRSREIKDKETFFLYQKLAVVFSPTLLINPLFYIYLLIGLVYGHQGFGLLKKASKSIRSEKHRFRGKEA